MNITVRDYTSRSAKGRVTGIRHTTYAVTASSRRDAEAKALRTHLRRIDQGDLGAATKIAATIPAPNGAPVDYRIL